MSIKNSHDQVIIKVPNIKNFSSDSRRLESLIIIRH